MQGMPDIAVIPVEGDLDVTSAPRLRTTIDNLVDGGCRRIIVNLRHTSYVDSAGVAMLIVEARELRALGGLLSLADASADVYRTFAIARLVDLIPVTQLGGERQLKPLDPSQRPRWTKSLQVGVDCLSSARSWMRGVLMQCAPLLGDDAVFDLTLAGGEALGNAVDHAQTNGALLTLMGFDDRVLCEVTDCGCGYELADDQEPEASCEERGRGIKLMRLLADGVSITRKQAGTGTVVRIAKLYR